jgi:hypothetical protein
MSNRGSVQQQGRCAVAQVSISDEDADILREVLDAKLRDLRLEISHTDSPRFRETLYRIEGMLQRLLNQLPRPSAVSE